MRIELFENFFGGQKMKIYFAYNYQFEYRVKIFAEDSSKWFPKISPNHKVSPKNDKVLKLCIKF